MRVVFMGTPDFAVPCLEAVLAAGHEVPGVFCQPDRPKGRGHKLAAPPVKQLAQARGIAVCQPAKLRDGTARALLESLRPDLCVVVAYGRILPPELLAVPPLGCVNVHASLLPKLRGAAPIQWSVLGGDELTGVTTMYMAEGLDTGDVILQSETPIGPDETAGELFERLSALGAELLARTLPLIEAGGAPRVPQDDAAATYAPPIDKAMGHVDFSKAAGEVRNLVRGLSPSPGAYALFGEERVKLHKLAARDGQRGMPPGVVLSTKPLLVACGEGAVELLTLQPPGKKPMDGAAWLNGLRGELPKLFT